MQNNKVIIAGAGLCGSLLALRLAQRGLEVHVYEKRPDLRKSAIDAGRSINLALSSRGIRALSAAGITEQLGRLCTPMHGRMIHTLSGDSRFSPYSGRTGEYINSISRPGLNALLLDQLDLLDNAKVHFNAEVQNIDIAGAEMIVLDSNNKKETNVKGDIIIGTDGASSAVRRGLMKHTNLLKFDYSQTFLSHGYKEIEMPANPDGSHKLSHDALHIWPRTSFMVIALPNIDGSFTMTLFHPYEGNAGFDTIQSPADIKALFEEQYADLPHLIPNYINEYTNNPTSHLVTIKCRPWQANGKVLIMGDAAHAIVPFYGQGMNASFEDVFVFDQLLEQYGYDWSVVLKQFETLRKPNADAIADLAVDNFYEMRDHVDDPTFIKKRSIETQLEHAYPLSYFSKYSMVTFNPDISYLDAMIRGRKQDALLMQICASNSDNIDLGAIHEQLNKLA